MTIRKCEEKRDKGHEKDNGESTNELQNNSISLNGVIKDDFDKTLNFELDELEETVEGYINEIKQLHDSIDEKDKRINEMTLKTEHLQQEIERIDTLNDTLSNTLMSSVDFGVRYHDNEESIKRIAFDSQKHIAALEESVRNLKCGLVERDHENKKLKNDISITSKKYLNDMAEGKRNTLQCHETISALKIEISSLKVKEEKTVAELERNNKLMSQRLKEKDAELLEYRQKLGESVRELTSKQIMPYAGNDILKKRLATARQECEMSKKMIINLTDENTRLKRHRSSGVIQETGGGG